MAGINLPFIITLAIAVVALVGIAVAVRRLRFAGTLNLSNASISAAAASLVLAGALLASVAVGAADPAAAAAPGESGGRSVVDDSVPFVPAESNVPDDGYLPVEIEDLEGFQLPTE
ncbi:MAG TPA: hypothetical protein VFS93_00850 [Terrimesophilobacter sp.]|nr:hypothetical protein [Terrimesophilobacter sp.]